MNRRVFKEKNFEVTGKVLTMEKFKPFIDKPQGMTFNQGHKESVVKRSETLLSKEIVPLIATDYMMYKRDGNRSVYEGKYFPRRGDILTLAFAETLENEGRFVDKIIDYLWLILEETSWVVPAHNPSKPNMVCPLPYAYTGKVDYIDLFSATTAATVSWVYYLCKEKFDKVTPLINERVLFELNRRIIEPYLDKECQQKMWWTGFKGSTNNWNPWIVSNVLTTCALTVSDTKTREDVVRDSLDMLDNFTAVYHDDGGCDEGPGYWGVAGAALFNACEVLYDMTNGYVNVYDDPLVKNMGEYEVKVCVNGNRFLNFADCAAKVNPDAALLARWGEASKSDMMYTYGLNRLGGKLPSSGVDSGLTYKSFKNMVELEREKVDFAAPQKFWLDGIIIAGTRESSATNKGLYLAIKGGHNAESHNHNDVGNIVVFADGKPIFLDAGSGTYTRRTFSGERYNIWAMCSDYHNCATINGVTQKPGKQYCSENHEYDNKTGGIKMSLKNAYPAEANIAEYTREAVLNNGEIKISDNISLNSAGNVMFSYICDQNPINVTKNSFDINGRTITFDKSLTYKVEELDKTWPEVERIPNSWDVDVLYRVTLHSDKFTSKEFVMTVK